MGSRPGNTHLYGQQGGRYWKLKSGGEIDFQSGSVVKIAGTDYMTGITAGTVAASKMVVVDANKDIAGFRQITCNVNGTVGLALTGTYTTTAIQLGTASTALTLTAHDDHIIDIYSTCGSTDGSNSVRPVYMKSTMSGAGGVGGRAEFHLYTNVALGGWSNAIKGFAEYGASGRTAGLGSAICAEIQLSAGTSAGTYAPIEGEIVLGSGASIGTATSFIYLNIAGAAASTFDTSGFLFEIGAGITPAAGKFVSADSQTIKCKIEANTRYMVLSQSENGLGIGVSGTAVSFSQGSPLVNLYSTCNSTHASNSVENFYIETTMTGAGGVGGRGRFYMTTNVALGGWSNALKAHVVYGASGKTTGLGSAFCSEIQLSAGTTNGTYAALEAEILAPVGCSTGTGTSFLYCNGNDASGLLNSNCYFFELGATIVAGAGKMLDSTINTNTPQIDFSLKCLTSSGIKYVPLMDNADGS